MPVTTIFREISRDVLKGLMFILSIDLLKKCHNLVNKGTILFLSFFFFFVHGVAESDMTE